MSSDICDFGRILKTECNLKHYSRTIGIKQVDELKEDEAVIFLWRAGLLENRSNVFTICYHHEQFFGKVFERKQKNCCGVLINHKRKGIKGEQLITLEMAQYLKSKDFNVMPRNMLCCQCKTKYNEMNNGDSDNNSQHITDMSDQEFDECETPKKKLNSSLQAIGVSPIDPLHAVAQHSRIIHAKSKLDKVVDKLKNNLSEAYAIEINQMDDSNNEIQIDQVELKEKAEELDRLHNAMREKLKTATYAEKLQILTLVPEKWSRQYCSQYFNVSEYLVRKARELKKAGGILNKPNPKRGKTFSNETLNLVTCFYEDDEYSRQMPGKKRLC